MADSMPMRIAIISPCMGRYGGLEGFVLTVAAGIFKIPGFNVEVIFKRAGAFELHSDLESKIRQSGVSVSFCDKASWPLWQAIRRADLVHLQNPCPDVAIMTRFARKPLLINIINHLGQGGGLHQRLWRGCLTLAKRRFYISEFVRRTWEGTNQAWPGSQVVFPICELSPLEPLPVGERKGFVFVARWIENKGLDTLVEAYASAALDPEQWLLHLLGDGPLRPKIEARVKELGLLGVDMPGFITEQEKSERIRRCRFAVIPPNTREDFGLVAIEARHLGLPCLITRDGGVPEAAGKYTLSCEPGDVDGLATLLRQAAAMSEFEYSKMASAAHESLESELVRPEFYASVYREMVAANRKGKQKMES
jgi:glycosyltransferase involved in cell wall biosynthesis